MPRNGSGTASVVNTFTPLTTADANQVNANFTDMASMITDSLPRDGQAGMTGQLLAISGTVGEPGVSWNADPDTGIRRPAGDEMALVCGGADVATVTSAGVAVTTAPTTGDHLTNKTYVDGRNPTGEVKMWATNTAPTGYLECNGAAVSRTTYAALFSVIGTTWGVGDGSTTFNVPDLRGEFVRGWDHGKGTDSGRTFASAQSDAIKNHVHTGNTTATTASLGGVQSIDNAQTGGSAIRLGTGGSLPNVDFPALPFTTGNNTGGSTVETRPRNVALMFIIKT